MKKYEIIYLFIFCLFSCSTITNIFIKDSINKKDYNRLEEILYNLESKKSSRYALAINSLRDELFRNHYELGDNYSKSGELDEAIKHYQKALTFQKDSLTLYVLNLVEKKKKEMDSIISYIKSIDTTNYLEKMEILNDYYISKYPVNCQKYLLQRISYKCITENLELYEILKNPNDDSLSIYLDLETFKKPSVFNCIDVKLEKFMTKYSACFLNYDNYKHKYFRYKIFKYFYIYGKNNSLDTEIKNYITENMKKYYQNNYQFISSEIDEVYLFFLFSSLIDSSLNCFCEKNIDEIAKMNSYRFVLKNKDTKNSTYSIIESLSDENIFNPFNINEVKYRFDLNISTDTIEFSINPEIYKKTISSKYISGTHTESNQDYNYWQDQVSYWNALYANAVSVPSYYDGTNIGLILEIARTNKIKEAKEGLEAARSKLSCTPTMIEVNDYTSYSFYDIGHSFYGKLKFSLEYYLNEKITGVIPISVEINEKTNSFLNVAPNDVNGYKEKISIIPSEKILENILINKAKKEILRYFSNSSSVLVDENKSIFNSKYITELLNSQYHDLILLNAFIDKFSNISDKENIRTSDKIIKKDESFDVNILSLKDIITRAANSSTQVVTYSNDYSSVTGTAYCISPNGFFVTNYHVVNGKENIILIKSSEDKIQVKNAKLVYSDKDKDLALLKVRIPFADISCVNFNENQSIELGDEILYVGFPTSPITSGAEPFTSRGIVSQVIKDGKNPVLLLLDLTANPGASGSAIINEESGALIGTLTWGFGRSITTGDLIKLIEGDNVRIMESQNVGTSVHILIEFLHDSGFYDN